MLLIMSGVILALVAFSVWIIVGDNIKQQKAVDRLEAHEKLQNGDFESHKNLFGITKNYSVVWVSAYGIEYHDVYEMMHKAPLTRKDKKFMKTVLAACAEYKAEYDRKQPKKYRVEKDNLFYGDVHIYEPCKAIILSEKQEQEGRTPRIAVKIERSETTNEMLITTAWISKKNVLDGDGTPLDIVSNDDNMALFKHMLDSGHFEEEKFELQRLFKRLEKYNDLVRKERIQRTDDGKYVFLAPTLDEYKERIEKEVKSQIQNTPKPEPKKEEPKKEEPKKEKPATTEAVTEEAKKKIEDEFVGAESIR